MEMNKTIYSIAIACAVLLSAGCKQGVDFPYQGKDRIQFKCYIIPNTFTGVRQYFTSRTFSFGLLPVDQQTGTAELVVEYLGTPKDYDRTYRVSIFADSTTAKEGVHYEAFASEQVIRAGVRQDTLKITVIRENMNVSFNDPKDARLSLYLEPTDDFDLGIEQGVHMDLLMNDYLTKPLWWDDNTGLDYYHPEKWRILIGFNELYANQNTCPFDINNDGRIYLNGLNNYLNEIPTYDKETGGRLYLTQIVMPEEDE